MTLCFVDTNIVLYSRDLNSPAKREVAALWLRELASRGQAVINLQVINEFRHVALRKFRDITDDTIRTDTESLREWGDAPLDNDIVETAWEIRLSHGYAWFDCLLLAAADQLGCTHFLSEDLQHGRSVRAISVINPFLIDPHDFLTG
jgi:predicted nucleic acid-binding protein